MKIHMIHILAVSAALLLISAPGVASADSTDAHFDSLLVSGADLDGEWTASAASGRVAVLKGEADRLRNAAESDLARNLYSMAEQRYRQLSEVLQEEISLLELLSYDAGSALVQDAAIKRLTDASRERDGAVEMMKLLALR